MKCSQLKSKANKTKSVDLIKYKKQRNLVVNFSKNFFFKLGVTPCKAEQPLRGMNLQEKEAQKD